MANLRDIKRRIGSVKNTQKITRAMKLVSAAKFARASHSVNAARPYSEALNEMVERLVGSSSGEIESSLLEGPESSKDLVVILGTDRGLCGGLNSNLFRFVRKEVNARQIDCDFLAWGRKAGSWTRLQKESAIGERERVLERPNYQLAKELVEELVEIFASEKYGSIYFAYSEFKNALTQTPRLVKFLPIAVDQSTPPKEPTKDFIVEPGLGEMIETLLARKLNSLVFQAMLEGSASEHGSRMTAMDSATTNADEVRKKLTLQYNRARQASITKELIEIISGSESL